MSSQPAVSVLLTAYNQDSYVEQALESVAAQTFSDFELIVTDDCSTDRSRQTIQAWLEKTRFPATFVANERNVGICAVRNRALRLARGRFVSSLAADDWYEPDRLERQHAFFVGLPDEVGLIYGDLRVCDRGGREIHPSYLERQLAGRRPLDGWIFDDLIRECLLPAPGVMIRRTALDAIGDYDETLVFEDYDMWLRLAERFQARYLPGVVSNYRELPTSLSRRTVPITRDTVRLLLKWLGRDSTTDRVVASRVRSDALQLARPDRRFARWALGEVRSIDPSWRWRLAEASLATPGGAQALAGARRARRIVPRRWP